MFVVRSVRCSAPVRPRRCTVSVSSSPSATGGRASRRRIDAAAPGWSRSSDPASRASTRAARSAESRFHASRNALPRTGGGTQRVAGPRPAAARADRVVCGRGRNPTLSTCPPASRSRALRFKGRGPSRLARATGPAAADRGVQPRVVADVPVERCGFDPEFAEEHGAAPRRGAASRPHPRRRGGRSRPARLEPCPEGISA